jgi:hypothetical protein
MPLDLLVPRLLTHASPASASTRLRSAERWLARAHIVREGAGSASAWLAAAHGLDTLPVAALERLAEAGPDAASWMRADPVHLRVERDALRLYGPRDLDVAHDEANEAVTALQSHFARDGLEFHVAAPDRWYVRLGPGDAPRTTCLDDAVGKNIFGLLPEEPRWRNALTEAQMILGGLAMNAERESAGKPPINSVWFWGAGMLPPQGPRPYAVIHGDDPLARGLASWSGAQSRALPRDIGAIDLARESDAVLVNLPAESTDIDEHWFAGLGRAIERFDRVRLVLPSPQGTLVAHLDSASRWRWFRPSRPLSSYA